MRLQHIIRPAIATGCCVMALSIPGCKKDQAASPNIILVLADDQGWGDMAYNGHPVIKTPNFDEMASTGLRFDRFYAAAPVSSPTRGSILTGRHPNRFGCFSWGHTLRPQELTIAQVLKKSGYVTGHFGKWHLGPVFAGSPVNPGASGFDEWLSAPNFFENDPILSREGIAIQLKGESSMVTMDAALDFIKKHNDSVKPFFAFVCFGSPHAPHIADEQDRLLYTDQEERFQHFYGEITGMDRAVGKLRGELKRMGIANNTVLWYVSDNGGLKDLGTTGGREFKGSIYEGGLRVPSIIEWPDKIIRPGTSTIPCNTTDIFPTLLELAGARIENQPILDGISLVPLLNSKMKQRSKPMGFWQHPTGGKIVPSHQIMLELLHKQEAGDYQAEPSLLMPDAGEINQQYPTDLLTGHSAWLDWPYKLHRIQGSTDEEVFELYNLEEDPMEEINLVNKDVDRVNIMKDQLTTWQRSVIESLNGKDY